MSRISNLTTIKIGLLRSWHSFWFDSYYYSYLLFGDLRIKDYITGIFYSLNTITDYLYIYRFISDSILIKTNLIFLSNINFKSIYIDCLYNLDDNYRFFYNKKIWNIFLSGLKVLDLFNNLKVSLDINISYEYFLNYYNIYRLLYYYNNNIINILYNSKNEIISSISSYKYCIVSNLFNLIYIDLLLDNSVLNIFTQKYSNVKNKQLLNNNNYISILNLNKHFELYNINLNNLILYYISSYVYCYENLIYYGVRNINIHNCSLLDSVKIFNSMNYFVYIFVINLLLLLKYVILLSSAINYLNLIRLSYLVPMAVRSNLILDNIMHRNYYNDYYNNLSIYEIRENITKTMVDSLRFNIEKSIYLFENKNIYFYFSLFIKRIPFLLSAKVITDYLVYMFESGNRIVKSFYYIRNLQRKFHKKRRELEYLFFSKKAEFQNREKYTKKQIEIAVNFYKYVYQFAIKRFPLLGIRIECNGSFKKGKMARTYHYTSWIKDYILTGSMPNNTLISDIDYYQYYTILNSSSIGIKTWIFLETYLYNSNNMYVGIVY